MKRIKKEKRTMTVLLSMVICFSMAFSILPVFGAEGVEPNVDEDGRIVSEVASKHNQSKNRDEMIASIDEQEMEYQIWQEKEYGVDAMRWRVWGSATDAYTSVSFTKEMLKDAYQQTKVPIEVETALGTYCIDNALMRYLVKNAKGKDIKFVLEKATLSKEEKKVFGEEIYACKAYFVSGGKKITNLDGNCAEITLSIRSQVTAIAKTGRLNSQGKLYVLDSKFGGQVGNYRCRFDTSMLGTFILASEARIAYAKRVTAVTSASISMQAGAGKNAVQLSWSKPRGFTPTGYQVMASSKKAGTYKRIKTTTKLSYTDSGLRSGTKKYYKVRAYSMVNGVKVYSKWSSVKAATAK